MIESFDNFIFFPKASFSFFSIDTYFHPFFFFNNNIVALLLFFFITIYLFLFLYFVKFDNAFFIFFHFIYKFTYELIHSYLVKKTLTKQVFPFLFFLFVFVLLNNLIGLLPFQFAITSHLSSTFSLAFFSCYLVITLGFFYNGVKFFKIILPKGIPSFLVPFLICIELISYIFRVVSLSVRLFANIFAGHVLLHVVTSSIAHLLLTSVTGFNVHLFIFGIIYTFALLVLLCFESIVACLQAYIILVLSCIYLRDLNNLSH
jgi:ATP synthase subunit 6